MVETAGPEAPRRPKDLTPEGFERYAWRALARGDLPVAERYGRILLRQVPASASGWAALRGALQAQGKPADAGALRAAIRPAAPESGPVIDRVARCRLSPRGFVFDPEQSVRIRPMAEVLGPVPTNRALREGANVVRVLDPGGDLVEADPVLELDGAGGAAVAVRYRTAPKFVASIRDAVVVGEALALTEEGELLEETCPPSDPRKYAARRAGDELAFDPDAYFRGELSIRVFEQPAFLMAGPTDANFGDWIVNFAPRLALYEAAGLDCPILVRPKLPAQVPALLEALGVKAGRLLVHGPKQVSLFPKLYVPSWPSGDKGAPMAGVFKIFRRAAAPATADRPRLYLTRQDVSQRPLLNEAEVCGLFASRGFQIVDPAKLSFEQTRRLFASPACVAGPFGSAFHNLVFSHNHPPSLVLMPSHLPYHLVEMALWQADCGNRFAYVLGETPARFEGAGTPWTVALDKLARALDRFLALVEAGDARAWSAAAVRG